MSGERVLVSVDPGIDIAGVALFAVDGWTYAEGFVGAARRLAVASALRTKPSAPLGDRLQTLAEGLRSLVADWTVWRVVMEEPATAGAYAERLRRERGSGINAASLAKLHAAIGALAAACSAPVELVRPIRAPKAQRLLLARGLLRDAGREWLLGSRPPADVLDAVSVGINHLMIRGKLL